MKRKMIAAAMGMMLVSAAAMGGEKEMNRALAVWQQQIVEYQAAYKLAATDEQRADLPAPDPNEIAPQLWKSISGSTGTRDEVVNLPRKKGQRATTKTRKVKAYEFEQPWAAPGVAWIFNFPEAFAKLFAEAPAAQTMYAEALLDAVLRVHYSDPIMTDICPVLATSTAEKAYAIAEKVFTHNPSPNARACAALALSTMLANPVFAASEGGDARARSKRIYYIRQALNLATDDARYGARLLTDAASEQIYRLSNLSIGSVPPQFSVTDTAGQTRYFPVQGRVNLIFFWSETEPVGRSIMSKQRALLTRYPELTLCPVVAHTDVDSLRHLCEDVGADVSFMDNEKGEAGLRYRVNTLPLAVLLNDRSRIVFIGYPDMQLQAALDDLFRNRDKAAQPTAPAPAPAAPARAAAPPLRPMPTP